MSFPYAQDAAGEFHRGCQRGFVGDVAGHDDTAGCVSVAAEIFGRTVHDEVGSELDRPRQIRRRKRAVNDKFRPDRMSDLGDRLNIEHL